MEKTLQDALVDLVAQVSLNKGLFKKKRQPSNIIHYYRKLITKQIIEHLEKGTLDEYLENAN